MRRMENPRNREADARAHILVVDDELQQLADAFNAMAGRLEIAFRREREGEASRRELVAAISHDLRSPLATMRAMIESINDGVVSDHETVERYLATLQSEIEYLSRLIDDLFELSQIDSGSMQLRPESVNLAELISDALDSLSVQAKGHKVTLQCEIAPHLPPLDLDPQRLQRVLHNLVQNAIHHTPAAGTITVRAYDAEAELHISVEDTGAGIAPQDMLGIFERFNRGGNRARTRIGGGSGLGLSIAKGIVELHGGRIWAESTPGKGATFTVALPKEAGTQPAVIVTA